MDIPSDAKVDPQLMHFIQQETEKQKFAAAVHSVNDVRVFV
jgi:hypothetical protein